MKKLLLLLLCIALIVPSVPAFAADRTTVTVSNYNNIEDNLLVSITTTDANFSGAEISLGEEFSHSLSASGKGIHTATISLASLQNAGQYPLTVVANYASGDSDVVEKTVNITKMVSAKTEYTYSNLNVTQNLNSGANTYTKIDEEGKEVKISYSAASTADVRIGRSESSSAVNPGGGNFIIDFEVFFKNGDATEKEMPNIYSTAVIRQGTPNTYDTVYPYNSANGQTASEGSSLKLFHNNGKLCETGPYYYTNTWYKCRYVFDAVTKVNDKYVGGLSLYIAEDEGDGYGEYKLLRTYPGYTIENLTQFRFEPRSKAPDASVTFKNISLTREVPVDSWNFLGWGCESGLIDLEFSEDMGEITKDDIKVVNKLNKDENGEVIPEEIEISAFENKGSGKYSLTMKNSLLYGRQYDILIKNDTTSASGAVGFKQPSEDENGDGFWHLTSVTAPKYPLYIMDVTDMSDSVDLSFDNTDISGKFAAVCWFDSNDNMVDCAVSLITAAPGDVQKFERSNSKTSSYIKVILFGVDTDSESANFGADTIYEVQ